MVRSGIKTSASEEEMENVHAIGEIFPMVTLEEVTHTEIKGITACVKEVWVEDDLSLIEDPSVTTGWEDAVGADGTLIPNEISYIKNGNGVDSLDEVVDSETVEQKLVYVTVEFTNTGDTDQKNVTYGCLINGIVEQNGQFLYK